MATNFDPKERAKYLSSTDAARMVKGHSAEIYLIKRGEMLPPDLSHIKAVQMGHVMQPVIGKLYTERTGIPLRDADYQRTHNRYDWIRSSYDFEANGFMVEAKNFGAHARKDFGDDGTNLVRKDLLAQCTIEAACAGVDRIDLAILFGGQEFCVFPLTITEDMKDQLIQQLAVLWGNIQSGTPPTPDSIEAAKALFPVSNPSTIVATNQIETLCSQLKAVKIEIKRLEEYESATQAMIQGYMAEHDTVVDIEGRPIATWKSAKGSMRFDSSLFKSSMPEVYEKFVIEVPGSRRFLLK